ncbi:MAG TPA: TonB-dependent receptor [Bacteroidales bacterium]|nr:TonB-dependent receptor [Bacteroidales bacterium]
MKRTLQLLFIIVSTYAFSQPTYTISGYLQDSATGEKLIGANIYTESNLDGTASNNYGFYSLTLEQGEYEITYSYVGYQLVTKNVTLNSDQEINVSLSPSIGIEEVEITATTSQSVKSSQMSSIDISVESIKKVPALLGEVDVIKAIQLLPGVQSGTEGASGLYVRGGGPDQNLILLDGTPVYNASHLFGFFSVFNADAINNVKLIKGGFPARYGGRSSSVLDISLKEGNLKEFKGAGSIGLIASKLTLEGPIIKDKASFIISGRRTYVDLIAQPIIRELADGDEFTRQGYYFYDLNAKVNYKISSKDHLYLSVYSGDDRFYQNQEPYSYLYDGVVFTNEARSNLGWGNITSAFRWNHQFSSRLFSNTSVTYSNYNYQVKNYSESIVESAESVTSEINSLNFLSGIEDFAGKIDFDFIPAADHYIRFGANYIYHTFKPGASVYQIKNAEVGDIDTTMGEDFVRASEFYLYVEDDYKINNRLKANLGLHYSGFLVNDRYYNSLQPRISARYLLSESLSFKTSYSMMQQYIHLLTNNNIGLPTDLWVPATDEILPQRSHQLAAGFSKSFGKMYLFSVEGYYKTMDNLIEYRDGASFMSSNTGWEDKVEMGKGWSYGGELFIEKKFGKLTGWLGYTLSWTNRQFEVLNNGEIFPYKYDRRHDIAIVTSFPLDDKWFFSASWIYGTGTAHTLPTERYFGANNSYFGSTSRGFPFTDVSGSNTPFTSELEHVDGRNSVRAANYHRLDVSFQKTKEKRWGEVTWSLGVYNLYSRKNPFYYYIGYDNRGNRALRRVSLFPFIPSVTYNFKF